MTSGDGGRGDELVGGDHHQAVDNPIGHHSPRLEPPLVQGIPLEREEHLGHTSLTLV